MDTKKILILFEALLASLTDDKPICIETSDRNCEGEYDNLTVAYGIEGHENTPIKRGLYVYDLDNSDIEFVQKRLPDITYQVFWANEGQTKIIFFPI